MTTKTAVFFNVTLCSMVPVTNVSEDCDNRDSTLHDITYLKTPTLKVKSVITFFFASISVQDEIWDVTQRS